MTNLRLWTLSIVLILMSLTVYAGSTLATRDSLITPPRYIDINGITYVVYSTSEDRAILKCFSERDFLKKELVLTDSLVSVYKQRVDILQEKIDNLNLQLHAHRELQDLISAQRDELKNELEKNAKKEKRRSTWTKILIGVGIVLTGGLLLLYLLKK